MDIHKDIQASYNKNRVSQNLLAHPIDIYKDIWYNASTKEDNYEYSC